MRFHNRLDNWRNTIGDWQNIPVTLSMQCEPTVSTTSCEVSNSTVPRTIGQWIGNPDRTYYLLSRANEASGPGSGDGEDGLNSDGSVGQHRLSWYNIAFWVTDDGAAGARYRCDSHTTIPGSGCTFDHSPMPWPINTQGQTFGYQTADVGRHIVDTFLFAEDTVPRTNEAKRIPGVYMSNGPLQRLEGSQVDKNRAASVAACKAEWGAGYSEGGVYDCDEYPMASTYQGADTAPYPDENNFSVRRIVASENQSAGRYLGWFYRTYRVIDSDMYYVFPYGSS